MQNLVDTGFDCINNYTPADQLADFLNAINDAGNLPKTIIYSLNPADDEVIGTIIGCFRTVMPSERSSRVLHGGSMTIRPV